MAETHIETLVMEIADELRGFIFRVNDWTIDDDEMVDIEAIITRHLTAWAKERDKKERDEKVRSLVSRAQREMGMVPPEQRTESDQQIYDLLCEALRELGEGGSNE